MKHLPWLTTFGVCMFALGGCTIDADDDDGPVRETVIVPADTDDEPDHKTEVNVNE